MRTLVHPRRRLIPTSSGRMSLAACGCCCPLDVGTCSARTQKSSGMARDDGLGERRWVRLLLHGPCGKRGTGECVFFLVHPPHRDHGSFWETGTGPRHASVYGCFWRISCPLRSRRSHLKSGALFPLSVYLAVVVPRVWVLLRST